MQYCDTPWDAIEDTIRRVRSAHPVIDAIYHTGDIVDHGVWETTENGNRQIMDRVYNLLKQVFPNTPIYNAIGNHEGKIFFYNLVATLKLSVFLQPNQQTCKLSLSML